MSLFGSIGRADWMEDSKCLDLTLPDADAMFFPADPNANGPAKRFCNGTRNEHGTFIDPPCPVRQECLEWALDNDERFGVWGGKSPRERQAEGRRRERVSRAIPPQREGVKRQAQPLGVDFNKPGNGCSQCQTRASAVTNAERDLGDLARRASQSDEIAAKLLDQIAAARATRDEARQRRGEHEATCLIVAAG